MRIAEAAIAAFGDRHALADFGEIGEQRLAVFFIDLRADRHLQHDVLAVGAVAVLAHAVAAALRLEVLLVAVVDQCVEAVDGLDHDVAAAAAIAAVRPAELDELLAPERHAAVPARAGRDIDLGFVEEFHGLSVYPIARLFAKDPGINRRKSDLVPCKPIAGRLAMQHSTITTKARTAAKCWNA